MLSIPPLHIITVSNVSKCYFKVEVDMDHGSFSLNFLVVIVPVALMNNLCAGLSYPLDLWSSTHSGLIILALQEITDGRIRQKFDFILVLLLCP